MGREEERETSMCGCLSHAPYWGTWPATQTWALNWESTSDPLVHLLAVSPLSHTSQGFCCLFKIANR